ncbi:MAG: hypothetical protein IJ087_05145 [Eggerthellaceae bacterium]|nr:hypothetical protein [Eggerthellaceae bacterium]
MPDYPQERLEVGAILQEKRLGRPGGRVHREERVFLVTDEMPEVRPFGRDAARRSKLVRPLRALGWRDVELREPPRQCFDNRPSFYLFPHASHIHSR